MRTCVNIWENGNFSGQYPNELTFERWVRELRWIEISNHRLSCMNESDFPANFTTTHFLWIISDETSFLEWISRWVIDQQKNKRTMDSKLGVYVCNLLLFVFFNWLNLSCLVKCVICTKNHCNSFYHWIIIKNIFASVFLYFMVNWFDLQHNLIILLHVWHKYV